MENGLMHTEFKRSDFEEIYFNLRKKEGWIYSTDELKRLPETEKHDPLHSFWQSRKYSATKILDYLNNREQIKNILDVGCGNGWLTNKLSYQLKNTNVFGVDIFETELHAAATVFKAPNLHWILGDVVDDLFRKQSFDIILLCASAQYFPDFKTVITQLQNYLTQDGEIHILDTPFYSTHNYFDAIKRTEAYYNAIGFPEMCKYYHHRQYSELQDFKYKAFFTPGLFNRILTQLFGLSKMEFPWLVIYK